MGKVEPQIAGVRRHVHSSGSPFKVLLSSCSAWESRLVTSLVLAALVFAALHLGLAGTRLRDRAVAIYGEKAYRGAFALASVVVLLWLILAYGRAPYLLTWGMLAPWAPVMVLLMLPATLLVVIGLVTPSPTAIGQERLLAKPPGGIVRVTRHPFLTGVALWALLHLVGNGDLASLVFFACFAVVAVFGTISIDAKRRRLMGEAAWLPFATRTSIIPFAAIIAGRNQFSLVEIGVWRILGGLLAYGLALGAHAPLFGVSPVSW
jgi:uncharacterized membrane protein